MSIPLIIFCVKGQMIFFKFDKRENRFGKKIRLAQTLLTGEVFQTFSGKITIVVLKCLLYKLSKI